MRLAEALEFAREHPRKWGVKLMRGFVVYWDADTGWRYARPPDWPQMSLVDPNIQTSDVMFSMDDVFATGLELVLVELAPPEAPPANPDVTLCKCGARCTHVLEGNCKGQVVQSPGEKDALGRDVHRCEVHAGKYGIKATLTISPEVAKEWFDFDEEQASLLLEGTPRDFGEDD